MFALESSAFESIYGTKLTLSIASTQLINFRVLLLRPADTPVSSEPYNVKIQILMCCPYMFLIEVVGEFDELSLN